MKGRAFMEEGKRVEKLEDKKKYVSSQENSQEHDEIKAN